MNEIVEWTEAAPNTGRFQCVRFDTAREHDFRFALEAWLREHGKPAITEHNEARGITIWKARREK